jgi:hypothetical protein
MPQKQVRVTISGETAACMHGLSSHEMTRPRVETTARTYNAAACQQDNHFNLPIISHLVETVRVVRVYPRELIAGEERHVNQAGLDWRDCQIFELQEERILERFRKWSLRHLNSKQFASQTHEASS